MDDPEKLRLLFLCTANSCRSQMAEALCRSLRGHRLDSYSAGLFGSTLDPLAVAVMREIGIDISWQNSKTVYDLARSDFDYVVTVCSRAGENCPVFPGPARVVHRAFDDPPKLAAGAIDKEEALSHYRRVRDEIKSYVLGLPQSLATADSTSD